MFEWEYDRERLEQQLHRTTSRLKKIEDSLKTGRMKIKLPEGKIVDFDVTKERAAVLNHRNLLLAEKAEAERLLKKMEDKNASITI